MYVLISIDDIPLITKLLTNFTTANGLQYQQYKDDWYSFSCNICVCEFNYGLEYNLSISSDYKRAYDILYNHFVSKELSKQHN